MNRNEHLHRLRSESFDLCIIGGGASGAGCALDAALRGLKVCLVEKTDFAAETSSRSTKLIHGGVRYLEQAFKKLDFAQLRQVRHGLEERHILLANAPHLAHPLPLLTPVFHWWEAWYYRIGLWLYDKFAAHKDQLPKSRYLTRAETLQRSPGLSTQLRGAVCYYDGQLDDARYCLALIQSAAEAGAVVVNHALVNRFIHSETGELEAAEIIDELAADGENATFRVEAGAFLNCAGPAADHLRLMANPRLDKRIQASKGAHIVLPADLLPGSDALLIPKTADGRVVFAVPFDGRVLVGTTDEPFPAQDEEPVADRDDLRFLLNTLQPYLARPLPQSAVSAAFAGLRPPIKTGGSHATKRMLRDHEVEHDPVSGLFSLMGGKWTTYRLMARDAVDAVCRQLQHAGECRTADYKLAGAARYLPGIWREIQLVTGLDEQICRHLEWRYGDRAMDVVNLAVEDPALAQALHPGWPFIGAEAVWAARNEMACTLRDVLARRVRLEIADWQAVEAVIEPVSKLLAHELGWDEAHRREETSRYRALLQSFRATLFA